MTESASDNPFHRAIYLTGPTAAGKTAVGVALARRLGAEVVALDSMTLYRGMDLGTAKPTLAQRGGIPHHLIDVLDPWESASVADYRSWARAALAQIEGRGRRALFVGGTALYLKALLRGLFDGPGADPELRRALENEAQSLGPAALHDRLRQFDAATAARLHPHDLRRVIRALEVLETTGKPLSAWHTEHHVPAPPEVPVIALDPPRATLRARIDARTLLMFQNGLIEEVKALLAAPQPLSSIPAQAVGYREVIDLLAGKATRDATIGQVQARTRQFAKRQLTWFRGLGEVRLFAVGPDEGAEGVAERLAGVLGIAN